MSGIQWVSHSLSRAAVILTLAILLGRVFYHGTVVRAFNAVWLEYVTVKLSLSVGWQMYRTLRTTRHRLAALSPADTAPTGQNTSGASPVPPTGSNG